MRRKTVFTALLTALLFQPVATPCFAAQPAKATPKPDRLLQSLQGEWLVLSSTGKPDSGHVFLPMVKKTSIRISSDIMSWVEGNGQDAQGHDQWIRIRKRIVPRPDISPLAVDLEPDVPQYKTWSRVAIVRSRGEELDLCVHFPSSPRPTDFKAPADESECVVLRRVRAAGEKPEQARQKRPEP